jgi:hypothetical protein
VGSLLGRSVDVAPERRSAMFEQVPLIHNAAFTLVHRASLLAGSCGHLRVATTDTRSPIAPAGDSGRAPQAKGLAQRIQSHLGPGWTPVRRLVRANGWNFFRLIRDADEPSRAGRQHPTSFGRPSIHSTRLPPESGARSAP